MELYDINRIALIISPSEALLKWAISEEPSLAEEVDIDDASDLASVYLIPEFEEIEEAEEWLEENFIPVLETLLEEWIPDENWPDRLELSHLEKYAVYSFSNIVIDTVDQSYDEN